MVFFLSLALTFLTFSYFYLARPKRLLDLFKTDPVEGCFVYSNFIFAFITAVLTSYTIIFEFNDIFPLNLATFTKRQRMLCEYTSGYLVVEMSFGIYFIIFHTEQIKVLKGYLTYHSIITFAYLSVLYYENAGIVILFTLWGEVYTIFSYCNYWHYWSTFSMNNRVVLEIIDIYLFTANRIMPVWMLVIMSLFDINRILSQSHLIFQFMFLLACFGFNHYWLLVEMSHLITKYKLFPNKN